MSLTDLHKGTHNCAAAIRESGAGISPSPSPSLRVARSLVVVHPVVHPSPLPVPLAFLLSEGEEEGLWSPGTQSVRCYHFSTRVGGGVGGSRLRTTVYSCIFSLSLPPLLRPPPPPCAFAISAISFSLSRARARFPDIPGTPLSDVSPRGRRKEKGHFFVCDFLHVCMYFYLIFLFFLETVYLLRFPECNSEILFCVFLFTFILKAQVLEKALSRERRFYNEHLIGIY